MKTSDSRRRAWKSCQRKYRLKYEEGVASKHKPLGRLMGSAFSLAIEHWDSGAMAPVFDEARDDVAYSSGNLTEIQNETTVIADAYMAHYPKPTLTEVEFKLDVPGTDAWNHGFIDCVDFQDARVTIIENKLLNPMFWSKASIAALRLDEQVLSYAWAGRHLYGGTDTTIEYRVTKKPMMRKKAAESHESYCDRLADDYASRPDHYFLSYELVFTDDEVDAFEENMIATINESATNTSDVWNSRACSDFGGCEFLDLCAKGDASNYVTNDVVDEEKGEGW